MKHLKSKINMKNLINLNPSRLKVFLLAALMGGMTACKDVLEPEMTTQQQSNTTSTARATFENEEPGSQDVFMKHLSSAYDAEFYAGAGGYFYPSIPGYYDDVDGLYISDYTDYGAQGNYAYYNQDEHFANRIDGQSLDGTASFVMNNYIYSVSVASTGESWKMLNVPEEVYFNSYQNMSNTLMSVSARNYLTSVGADAVYTDSICKAISDGRGSWTMMPVQTTVMSKGAGVGLHHSDFGLIEGPVPVAGEPSKHETYPYIGGVSYKRVNASSDYAKYKGTAYVSVMPTDDLLQSTSNNGNVGRGLQVFATDSAAATFSHGAVADTLVMPFNDWYTVTIITQHSNNQMKLSFDNFPTNLWDDDLWGTRWSLDCNPFVYYPVQKNEMPNGVNFYNYNSQTGQFPQIGYKSVDVSVSEPLFYDGENTGTTTGLDYVYCAPARRTQAEDDSPYIANEAVINGSYKELHTDAVSTKGTEIGFVFGGVRQR